MKEVDHPEHYTDHPSGVECIDITEHMSFNLGNAIKYIWRSDLKSNTLQDLEKAIWYIKREIDRKKPSTEEYEFGWIDPKEHIEEMMIIQKLNPNLTVNEITEKLKEKLDD